MNFKKTLLLGTSLLGFFACVDSVTAEEVVEDAVTTTDDTTATKTWTVEEGDTLDTLAYELDLDIKFLEEIEEVAPFELRAIHNELTLESTEDATPETLFVDVYEGEDYEFDLTSGSARLVEKEANFASASDLIEATFKVPVVHAEEVVEVATPAPVIKSIATVAATQNVEAPVAQEQANEQEQAPVQEEASAPQEQASAQEEASAPQEQTSVQEEVPAVEEAGETADNIEVVHDDHVIESVATVASTQTVEAPVAQEQANEQVQAPVQEEASAPQEQASAQEEASAPQEQTSVQEEVPAVEEAGETADNIEVVHDDHVGESTYINDPLSNPENAGLQEKAASYKEKVGAKFGVEDYSLHRAGDPGDHGQGLAVDFMTYDDRAKGDAIAEYSINNMDESDINYVIWEQQIYGDLNRKWEPMEDRGSVTANHYDHVHVSFNP